VIWGGEFGRTPTVELPKKGSNEGKINGRDHNHHGFTMWLAGDAEHEALDWFDRVASYSVTPAMHVNVLKANHHGSCNGVTDRYLDLTHPELVVASVGAVNDYGHMHEQAMSTFSRHGIPWYRTDQNGTITIRSAGLPGSGFTVSVEHAGASLRGPSDRRAHQAKCVGM